MVGSLNEEDDAERDKSRFDFGRRKSRSNDNRKCLPKPQEPRERSNCAFWRPWNDRSLIGII